MDGNKRDIKTVQKEILNTDKEISSLQKHKKELTKESLDIAPPYKKGDILFWKEKNVKYVFMGDYIVHENGIFLYVKKLKNNLEIGLEMTVPDYGQWHVVGSLKHKL